MTKDQQLFVTDFQAIRYEIEAHRDTTDIHWRPARHAVR